MGFGKWALGGCNCAGGDCSGCPLPTGNGTISFTPDTSNCFYWDGNFLHLNPPYTPSNYGPFTLAQISSSAWGTGCQAPSPSLVPFGNTSPVSIDILLQCSGGSYELTISFHNGTCASPTNTVTYSTPANFTLTGITCSPHNQTWSVTPQGTECGSFPVATHGHAPFTAVTITFP